MTASFDRDRLIDRLVDGELPESDRQLLLAHLDTDLSGSGWRACALAFLEAQAWRESLGPVARAALPVETPSVDLRRRLHWPLRLAAAAGVLAAFALGWVVRDRSGAEVPVAAAPAPPPVLLPSTVAPVVPPPTTVASTPEPVEDENDDRPEVIPETVLARWQQRGYQVERQQRVLSVGLDNGRKVPLPVDEVRVKYVGNHIY